MVYIYKKLINGRPYYYLRLSVRSKDRIIVKDIAYLGNNLKDIEKKLDQIKEYKEAIRKSYKSINKFLKKNYYLDKAKTRKLKESDYIDFKLLDEIEAIRLHYNQKFLRLDEKTKHDIFKQFLIDFAFNTTSLEGNTIKLQQATALLESEMLPKNNTLREVYDLQNTQKVFFYLINEKPRINENLLIKIHDMLLDRIDDRKGYRKHEIRVFKSKFDSSPVKYIATDVKLVFKMYNKYNKVLHPLVFSSIIHHKLEKIHPFADGNGRTGRILLNYILFSKKYPPLIVPLKKRRMYLNALNKADKSDIHDISSKWYGTLVKFMSKEMIYSYWNNFMI